MKYILAAALLIGAALGNSTAYYGWKPDQEYVYHFESELLSGIPNIRRSQYSGLKLSSTVRVQAFRDYTLRIKFDEPRFLTVNDEQLVLEKGGRPVTRQANQEVPQELRIHLVKPFEVHLKKGLVESLFVENSEPVVVTNIKKAFLGQIQTDLSGSRRRESSKNLIPDEESPLPRLGGDDISYLNTKERSIMGDCDVLYTISPLPKSKIYSMQTAGQLYRQSESVDRICQGKEYFQILKTKNFDQCKERPVYQTTYGMMNKCDFSKGQCGELMTHSSNTRYIACGNQEEFVIRQIFTNNDIATNPLGWVTSEDKMESKASISLSLRDIKTSGYTPFPLPQQKKQKISLLFEFPNGWSSESHNIQPTKDNDYAVLPKPGLTSASLIFPSTMSMQELKEKIPIELKKIADVVFKSPQSCAEKSDISGFVSTIARLLRPLSLNQLKEIERAVTQSLSSSSESIKKIGQALFVDILAIAGSNPTTMLLKEEILANSPKVVDRLETLVASTIRNVQTPTEELVGQLFQMVKSLQQQNMQAHLSSVLHLSNLLYTTCVDGDSRTTMYPSRIYGHFCNRDSQIIAQDFIPYLSRLIESENDSKQQVLYITALGKLGHKGVLVPLAKVIEGKISASPLVRAVAVHALKRVAQEEPTRTKPILMSVIYNNAEHTQVRIGAVSVLPFTQPSVGDLQKIATRTWFDPSIQVSSFISSTLYNLAKTQNPELRPLSLKVQTILNLVKPFQEGVQYSKNAHTSNYVDSVKTSFDGKVSYTITEDALVPTRASVSTSMYGAGLWKIKAYEATSYLQGMDGIVEKILDLMYKKPVMSEEIKQTLEQVQQRLGAQIPSAGRSPKAIFQYSSFGYDKQVALDENVIGEIIRQAERLLLGARTVSAVGAQNLIDVNGYGPSETGFAIYVIRNMPVVYGIKGQIETDSSQMQFSASLIPVVNAKIQGHMGVISPFSKQMLGAGTDASLHSSFPMKSQIGLEENLTKAKLSFKIPQEINHEVEWLHLYVLPYTSITALDKLVPMGKSQSFKPILSGNPKKQVTKNFAQYGVDATIRVDSDYSAISFGSLWNSLSGNNWFSALFSPLMPPSSRQNSIEVVYNPQSSRIKEVDVELKYTAPQRRYQSESSQLESSSGSYQSHNSLIEETLEKMSSGYASGISVKASVGSGDSQKVEGSVVYGREQEGSGVYKTHMTALLKVGNNEQSKISSQTRLEVPQVQNRWDLDSIVRQSLDMKLNGGVQYRILGGSEKKISFGAKWSKTQAYMQSVRDSSEVRTCKQEESKGFHLASVCEEARHQASSINRVDAQISLPKQISQNSYVQKLKYFLLGYGLVPLDSLVYLPVQQYHQNDQFSVGLEIDRLSSLIQAEIHSSTLRLPIKMTNVRSPYVISRFFPLSLRNGVTDRLWQKVTRDQIPASCRLDGNFISTFDNKTYTHDMSDTTCPHVLISPIPNQRTSFHVTASQKSHSSSSREVFVTIAGSHKVDLKSNQITVDGQPIQLAPGATYYKRNEQNSISFFIHKYMDQVVLVKDPHQGTQVFYSQRSGRMEIVAPQSYKNRVFGLCGDLNGENTADLKSPQGCVLSAPIIKSAYLLVDNSCSGIPERHAEQYRSESIQCYRKVNIPTKVVALASKLASQPLPKAPSSKHVVHRRPGSLCFSKQTIPLCKKGQQPQQSQSERQAVRRPMDFVCFAEGSKLGQQLAKRAEAGEPLTEVMILQSSYRMKVTYIPSCSKDYNGLSSQGQLHYSSYKTSARDYGY